MDKWLDSLCQLILQPLFASLLLKKYTPAQCRCLPAQLHAPFLPSIHHNIPITGWIEVPYSAVKASDWIEVPYLSGLSSVLVLVVPTFMPRSAFCTHCGSIHLDLLRTNIHLSCHLSSSLLSFLLLALWTLLHSLVRHASCCE